MEHLSVIIVAKTGQEYKWYLSQTHIRGVGFSSPPLRRSLLCFVDDDRASSENGSGNRIIARAEHVVVDDLVCGLIPNLDAELVRQPVNGSEHEAVIACAIDCACAFVLGSVPVSGRSSKWAFKHLQNKPVLRHKKPPTRYRDTTHG